MWYKKLLSSIRDIVVTPTELERNRRAYYSQKNQSREHIEQIVHMVIISCKTTDHTASCLHWVEYMLDKKIIDLFTYEGLKTAISLKKEEIQVIPRPHSVLPHLVKRAEILAKDPRHLRVVKNLEVN